MLKADEKTASISVIPEKMNRIEYSNHESNIFGVPFGRIDIEEYFTDWTKIQEEIAISDYKYIRAKVKNPINTDIDHLKELGKSAHLLEIVKSYTTERLDTYEIVSICDDYVYVKVTPDTKKVFFETFNETYEDIPFGTYTPGVLLERFSLPLQRECLSTYFYNYYDGNCPGKESFLIYNKHDNLVGCLTIDFFEDETYSYYVGIRKEFRKNDILLKTINFIHLETQRRNLFYVKGSARLHNVYSQKAFDKSGMKCTGYDWIFLIEQ